MGLTGTRDPWRRGPGSAAASSELQMPDSRPHFQSEPVLCDIYIPVAERDLDVTPPLTKQSGKNGSEMADYFRRRGGGRSGRAGGRTAAK